MKKRLFIIGAGGMGREMEFVLDAIAPENRDWQIAGYLHSGKDILSAYPSDYKIVGDWTGFQFLPDDQVLLATADSAWKRKIVAALKGKVEFFTFICPGTIVGKFARIGRGTVIYPNVLVSTNVEIGEYSTINIGSVIGHDAKIGDYSSLMAHVDLGGWAEIGTDVFMGTKSTLVPKKKIADRCQIAAGAVVMRSVKTHGATIFGNPAEIM